VRLEFHELQGKYMTAHPQQWMWLAVTHSLIFSFIAIVWGRRTRERLTSRDRQYTRHYITLLPCARMREGVKQFVLSICQFVSAVKDF